MRAIEIIDHDLDTRRDTALVTWAWCHSGFVTTTALRLDWDDASARGDAPEPVLAAVADVMLGELDDHDDMLRSLAEDARVDEYRDQARGL